MGRNDDGASAPAEPTLIGRRTEPQDLPGLLETVSMLESRLHRIAFALSLSEEVVGDVLTRCAASSDADADALRAQGSQARARAAMYREFGQRIDVMRAARADTADIVLMTGGRRRQPFRRRALRDQG